MAEADSDRLRQAGGGARRMANRWSTGPLPWPTPSARPASSPCHTKSLARPTASRRATPCASSAAIAADSVQPVPCVWRVSMRGPHEALDAGGVAQDVDRLLAAAVPALDQHGAAAERTAAPGLRDRLGLARGLLASRAGARPRAGWA